MNRMLETDLKVFVNDFPSAIAFLTAAHLRFELLSLARLPEKILMDSRPRKGGHLQQARELIVIPACLEYSWFKELPEIQRLLELLEQDED